MPLLSLELNQKLEPTTIKALLDEASSLTANLLGKPENYVMVRYHYNPDMRLAGHDAPLALLKLDSIGLPERDAPKISHSLCTLLERHTGVPASRIYILFAAVPRGLWGYDGGTF